MSTDLQERLKNLSPANRARILSKLREDAARLEKSRIISRRSQVASAQLSFAQQRLWFIQQLEPNSSAYNFLLAARLKGELNVEALTASLNEIIRRHEVLRTTFALIDGQPRQVIGTELKLKLREIDLRAEPEETREAAAERLVLEQVAEPFALACGPLLRVSLVRLGAADQIVVLVMHHIISDGWSLGLFMRELGLFYEGFAAGRATELEELAIQYGDYAEWQRGWLTGEVLEEQLGYWRKQLAGMAALQLPTDRPRPANQSFRGYYQSWTLPLSETEQLNAFSRQEGVTLFMTLMMAFQILLHCLTQQTDIVVGTDVANRNRTQIEKLIGFFINQLVLRLDLSGDPTLRQLLQRVHQMTLEAYAHQDLPFETLVAELQPERAPNKTPLFQVKLVLQNYPSSGLGISSLTLDPVLIPVHTSKHDLLFNIYETEQGLAGVLEYDTSLFEARTIARFLRHYETILNHLVSQPDMKLKAIANVIAQLDEQQWTNNEDELHKASLQKLRSIKRRPFTGSASEV